MKIPTEKLRIIDTDNAVEEILAFARHLESEGREPCFEVRYPAPDHLESEIDQQLWLYRQEDTFDAVMVEGDEIITLPPYEEILNG